MKNVIILIIVCILLAVGYRYVYYKHIAPVLIPIEQSQEPSAEQATPNADDEKANLANWPMHRGNPALTGVAEGTLSENLELLWKFSTPDAIVSSAVIDTTSVYVGSSDGNLYAVSLKKGEQIWKAETGNLIEATPLIVGDMVYIGSADGIFYAFDRATGEKRWTYPTDAKILGAANTFQTQAGRQCVLVGSYDSFLYCLDAADGELIWKYESGNFINGTPAISGGHIVFGGCDAQVHVLDAETGTLLHQVDAESEIAGSVAFDGRYAWVGTYGDLFLCVDTVEAGILWRFEDKTYPFISSPALTADQVLIGSRARKLYCLGRKTGVPAWEFTARDRIDSSPVVCDNKVVFGSDDGRIYMISLDEGELLWSYEIGRPITASPAVANGLLIIGSEDGSLYAFAAK